MTADVFRRRMHYYIHTVLQRLEIEWRGISVVDHCDDVVFASLILRSYGKRTVGDPKIMRTMIRVYIGLEDPEDMINDLDQAMTKMRDV